jgi:hypothetical protein
MLNAINNTQEAVVTKVVSTKSITSAKKLSSKKQILLQNKIAKKAFQAKLEVQTVVPTHTTTQGVDQMNTSLIQKIKQATSLAEINAISNELSHKSKKVANAIANVIATLTTPAVQLCSSSSRVPVSFVAKSEWPSTIQAQKEATKRRALKLAKAETKTEAEIEAAAKVETLAKVKADTAKAKAEVPSKGWFCPSALVCLSKALGLTSFCLSNLNLDLLNSHIPTTITQTQTQTIGSQSTAAANQLQPKQGERNMIQNHFSIPDTEITDSLLQGSIFESTKSILNWLKPELSFDFNGLRTSVKGIDQDNPGLVNLVKREITLSDKLTENQMVRALVHELDHLNYGDLLKDSKADQLKLLKTLEQCKAHSNCPKFLDEANADEELWVRHRDYLRGDDTYVEFFLWYTNTTNTEASETSQQKEPTVKKIRTTVSKKTVKKNVIDEILNNGNANSLIAEVVFLNDKNSISMLADLATTWSLPLDVTAEVMGLSSSKFLKVSWKDNSLSQRFRLIESLNAAGWYMISETIATDRESAKIFFDNCFKIFPSLTAIINYGKALTTTPQKLNIETPRCFLFNEKESLGWSGNDGAGLETAGTSNTITQFRMANLNGRFGKGIVTDSKLILENRKVINVDNVTLSENAKRNFQSWLLNPNSDSIVLEENEYLKGCLIAKSNLKGIDKAVPDGDLAVEVSVDFWSTMLAKHNPKPGKLLMPNQLSYMVGLTDKTKQLVINKILKKAITGIQKFNLRRIEKLTKSVLSLGNIKFKTNYVQMADMNLVKEDEKCQQKIIDGSVNFVPDLDWEDDQLVQPVHMLRTPIQDPNAIIDIPAYNPKLVYDILNSKDHSECQHFCTQEEYDLVKKVVPEKLFKSVIAKNVAHGIIWLDCKVQAILVGDNDGDMNAWMPKGSNPVIDEVFEGVKAFQRKDLIIKESLKIFVLENDETKDPLELKAQKRLVVPNGGQLNVGSISNAVLALRGQIGFNFMAEAIDKFAFTSNNIQQSSIDRQKYKYVLPSLVYAHLYRGAVKINLDKEDRNLVIPGVSFVAKGHTSFLQFNEKVEWTTDSLKAWFKESFVDYDDFGPEMMINLKGEEVNIYDPEGYSEFGCRLFVQKLILSIKLIQATKSKESLENLVKVMDNLPSTLAAIREADAYADYGLVKAEVEESGFYIQWKNDITHQSCPENLKGIRDGVLDELNLDAIYSQIKAEAPESVKTEYFDSSDDDKVVKFINTLLDLKKLSDDLFRDELANIGRSQSKQQEQSSLGCWVNAADQLGLEWLVSLLANNRLETNLRNARLRDIHMISKFVAGFVVYAYEENKDNSQIKEKMLEVIDAVALFLDIIEEANENNNTAFFTNAVLVKPAVEAKEMISSAKDLSALKLAIKSFRVAVVEEIISFIRENHYENDSEVSDERILLSHHWSRMDQNLNLAYRLDKALALYSEYGLSLDFIKASLPSLILKEVGYGKNKKLVVPSKVSYLLDDNWWGELVKNLLSRSSLVNVYYPVTINLNGSYTGDFEPQGKKAWLTFTDKKIAEKFTLLAPLGLSEVVSKTQVINLGLESNNFGTQDDEEVLDILKGNSFDMKEVRRVLREIEKQSIFLKGKRYVGEEELDEVVAFPIALLLRRRNNRDGYNYASSFRKAMHLLSGTSFNRNLENLGSFEELYNQMFPTEVKEFCSKNFDIDLHSFQSSSDKEEYNQYVKERDELKKQKCGSSAISRRYKLNELANSFRAKRAEKGSSWQRLKKHLTIEEKGYSESQIRQYMVHTLFAETVDYLNDKSIDAIVFGIKKAEKYNVNSIFQATLLLLGFDSMIQVYVDVLKNTTPVNEDQQNMMNNCRRALFSAIKHLHLKNVLTNSLDENKEIEFHSGNLTGLDIYKKVFSEVQFQEQQDREEEFEESSEF